MEAGCSIPPQLVTSSRKHFVLGFLARGTRIARQISGLIFSASSSSSYFDIPRLDRQGLVVCRAHSRNDDSNEVNDRPFTCIHHLQERTAPLARRFMQRQIVETRQLNCRPRLLSIPPPFSSSSSLDPQLFNFHFDERKEGRRIAHLVVLGVEDDFGAVSPFDSAQQLPIIWNQLNVSS